MAESWEVEPDGDIDVQHAWDTATWNKSPVVQLLYVLAVYAVPLVVMVALGAALVYAYRNVRSIISRPPVKVRVAGGFVTDDEDTTDGDTTDGESGAEGAGTRTIARRRVQAH